MSSPSYFRPSSRMNLRLWQAQKHQASSGFSWYIGTMSSLRLMEYYLTVALQLEEVLGANYKVCIGHIACWPFKVWVCTGMWYHKDSKSSKNKCNSGSVYSGCLAKGVREGRGFIPVAVTPLKPLRLPAGSWRGYIKHSVWVLWTNKINLVKKISAI